MRGWAEGRGRPRRRQQLVSAASRKVAAPEAGSQGSGSQSGNHLRVRTVAPRRGLRHPHHVVGLPRQRGLSALATVVDEYSWGGAGASNMTLGQMCACWSGRWRPAACWPRRRPQMSWLVSCVSLSATLMSHDTSGPSNWPPVLSGTATLPHPHLKKDPTFAKAGP